MAIVFKLLQSENTPSSKSSIYSGSFTDSRLEHPLNASVSTALIIYEIRRKQRK